MKYGTFVLLLSVVLSLITPNQAKPPGNEPRLSLNDAASSYFIFEPEGKGTYAFGYDIDDPSTENKQFKDEERKSDGTVTGKYGWVADNGLVYIVSYVADQFGYRSHIEIVPVWKFGAKRT